MATDARHSILSNIHLVALLAILMILAALVLATCADSAPVGGDAGPIGGGEDTPDTENDAGEDPNAPDQEVAYDPVDTATDYIDDYAVELVDLEGEEVGLEYVGLEPNEAATEWGDCLSQCDYPQSSDQILDVLDLPFDAYRGQLDDRTHWYDVDGIRTLGPDVDIVAIRAPARTMLEITVTPDSPDSLINPLITTHDGFDELTFNDDAVDGSPGARTVIASPFTEGTPFYLIIEDASNHQNLPTGPWLGGEDYGYILRFRVLELAPTDLGELTVDNSPLQVSGAAITSAGDIHYYRLRWMATAEPDEMPEVVLNRVGTTDFVGYLVGMDTIDGNLIWHSFSHDEAGLGQVELGPGSFKVCVARSCEGMAEYFFAVSDWNGLAYPGLFSYDLRVTVP